MIILVFISIWRWTSWVWLAHFGVPDERYWQSIFCLSHLQDTISMLKCYKVFCQICGYFSLYFEELKAVNTWNLNGITVIVVLTWYDHQLAGKRDVKNWLILTLLSFFKFSNFEINQISRINILMWSSTRQSLQRESLTVLELRQVILFCVQWAALELLKELCTFSILLLLCKLPWCIPFLHKIRRWKVLSWLFNI